MKSKEIIVSESSLSNRVSSFYFEKLSNLGIISELELLYSSSGNKLGKGEYNFFILIMLISG
jgi:hypothetical protein